LLDIRIESKAGNEKSFNVTDNRAGTNGSRGPPSNGRSKDCQPEVSFLANLPEAEPRETIPFSAVFVAEMVAEPVA
jgi:hypothetical protein